jgi:hypothetical protein
VLWHELDLGRAASDEELARAWAAAFGVPTDAVALIGDPAEFVGMEDEGIRLVLIRWQREGQFPLHVEPHPQEQALFEPVQRHDAALQLVERVCAALGCAALIADTDANPYDRLLVGPRGAMERVQVQPEPLDERDELVIAAREPITRKGVIAEWVRHDRLRGRV